MVKILCKFHFVILQIHLPFPFTLQKYIFFLKHAMVNADNGLRDNRIAATLYSAEQYGYNSYSSLVLFHVSVFGLYIFKGSYNLNYHTFQ